MFNWSEYLNYATKRTYKKDTVLFRQGESVEGFYLLQKGIIMISVLREDGFERIIDIVYPDSLIGEQMIYSEASFTNAKAQVDSTLYYFSESQFELLCKSHPEVAIEFGKSLIKKIRLQATSNSILNAPIDVQLAHFLLNLSEKKGSNIININQTSLANYIGKSRVAVWKVLKEWKDEEILEVNQQSFIIKNIQKLKKKIKDY